jgi:hypothetical protein
VAKRQENLNLYNRKSFYYIKQNMILIQNVNNTEFCINFKIPKTIGYKCNSNYTTLKFQSQEK